MCGRCGGTGIAYPTSSYQTITESPCTGCSGTGFHVTGKVDGANELEWIKNKIKKILKKLDIEE